MTFFTVLAVTWSMGFLDGIAPSDREGTVGAIATVILIVLLVAIVTFVVLVLALSFVKWWRGDGAGAD